MDDAALLQACLAHGGIEVAVEQRGIAAVGQGAFEAALDGAREVRAPRRDVEVVVERVVEGDARHHHQALARQARVGQLRPQLVDAAVEVVETTGAQHVEQPHVAAAGRQPEAELGQDLAVHPGVAVAHHEIALQRREVVDAHQAIGVVGAREQQSHAQQAATQRLAHRDQPAVLGHEVGQHHHVDIALPGGLPSWHGLAGSRDARVPQLALATLLIEQWSANDWSQLWWVRAELQWQGDLAERAASLAALLADKYPQYRDQPFARVLVLRVVALTGWSAAEH